MAAMRTSWATDVACIFCIIRAPVGFDGLFACAQGIGDFLVQQAGDHQVHDFPLARGQRGDALAQLGLVALAIPRTRVLLQGRGDGGEQRLVVHRLQEEIDGPCLHSPHTQGNGPMAGEK